ncbi:MAG: hypothetical protein IPM88_20660 [Nitrospira sp.]|nr:hypothetical protein [Nitrospira sp.]
MGRTALNGERMYIDLKPLGERMAGAGEIIRRIEARVAEVDGITLRRAVQDLTVEDRVSRIQFNIRWKTQILRTESLGSETAAESLRVRPEQDVSGSDQLDQGLASLVEIGQYCFSHRVSPLIADTLRCLRSAAVSPPCSTAEPVPRHS